MSLKQQYRTQVYLCQYLIENCARTDSKQVFKNSLQVKKLKSWPHENKLGIKANHADFRNYKLEYKTAH